MERFNDMNKSQRTMKNIVSVEVVSVDERSGYYVGERTLPNGKTERNTYYYIHADELEEGMMMDVMPVLSGNTIGWKTLGRTLPKYIGGDNGVARTAI